MRKYTKGLFKYLELILLSGKWHQKGPVKSKWLSTAILLLEFPSHPYGE